MTLVDAALVTRVTERLALAGEQPTATAVTAALRQEGAVLGSSGTLALVAEVRSELTGFGPLEALLADDRVSDVLVNGPAEVWVDRGAGLARAAVTFRDEAAVRRLAQRLAASAGRRLDVARPTVDARLAGGVRLHAVLPPVSPAGTLLSLRVLRRRAFTVAELVDRGTLVPALAELLERVVRCRRLVPRHGRHRHGQDHAAVEPALPGPRRRSGIVLVEDSGELRARRIRTSSGSRRAHANVEGPVPSTCGRSSARRSRMRPDRIVVGEVRGGEVVELLAALNTGHDGGAGTVHASGPAAAAGPARGARAGGRAAA